MVLQDPDCLAVLTSSNEVLRLNVLELMSAGEPGKPVQESVIRRRGNVYEHSESVAAFTFSPDGSLLATLTSADSASANATLRFFSTFSTSGPSAIQVMNVSQPPGVNALAGDERGISHFTLVSAPEDDSVRAALIGYGRNRLLGLWDLGEQRWRDVWRFDDAGDGHYNQVSYHSATGTLLIANSFRSSIFSIRFAFSSMPPAPSEFERSLEPGELAEDSQLLPARLRQGSQAFPWTVEVLRISEMAVPEPTVSFVAARTDPSAGEAQGLNIFAAHPRGIHALAVPEEAMRVIAGQAKPAAPQAQNEVTTRPSNENEAETWVAVTPPTTSAPRHEDSTATPAPKPESVTPARIATPSSDREGKRQKAKAKKAAVSASPAPVPAPAPTTVPAPPESVAAKEPASGSENLPSSELADAKLSGPVINGAIKELKKANTNGKKSHSRSASHASQGPSSKHAKMENNGTATPVHAAEATTAAPTAVSASSEELKGLFADLEDRLAARLLPSPRATEAVPAPPAPAPVDLSGLEQSLAKLMLDSKPTDKQLEPIIRNEMQRTVLPAVTATVREAVNQHIGYGLADSMKVALPSELQKLLLRPDVSSHLTRSFASGVLPLVERTVSESIMQVLVPQFQDATDAVADRVLREIHAEVTGVRKTIVAEQSEALKETEVRMREMARQMEAMQAQMAALVRSNERLSQSVAQMERRAPITQAQPVPEQPPSRASIAQVVSPAYQTAQHTPPAAATVAQQQKAAASSAAPPPPAATPAVSNQPDDIEDRFLTALSHSDPTQAEYRWLHELLTSFAYQGGPAAVLSKGLLSQPVILTLLHRLATSLVDPSSGTGAPAPAATLAYPHLPYELAVPWIEASAQALRPQEQAIAAYYPRVSELVRRALIVAQQAAQPHQQHLRRPGAVLAPWWSEERLRAAALAYLP